MFRKASEYRKKWKNYDYEKILSNSKAEDFNIIYHFRSTSEPTAKLTLTRAGYLAILKKDGKYFHTCWDVVLADDQ